MLTLLLPEQVSEYWNIIKYGIESSLPPTIGESPDKMNRILSSLLCNRLQCWASYKKVEDKIVLEGIVVTKILYDDGSDTRNLLIYCLYGYKEVGKGSWLEGLKALAKYANAKRCSRIIAYTDVPYIVDIVKKLGGEAKYTFVSLGIN